MSSQSIDDLPELVDDESHDDLDHELIEDTTTVDTFELVERCESIVNKLRDYAMTHGLNMLTSDNATSNLVKLLE